MGPSFSTSTLCPSLLVLLLIVSVAAHDWHEHGPEPMKGKGDHGPNKKEIGLKMMFYKSCSQVETIVREITWSRVAADSTLAAKLLRLHYHDCFVRGCDASILLDSSDGTGEKNAIPNSSLGGYQVIDEIKEKLEEYCPATVSCADIVALAARDAVSYQFRRPLWPVFTGRRDGRVSLASEALQGLPSAAQNFTTLKQVFAKNGLDVVDLVTLSGAHTIGVAHCGAFSRRVFNFTGKGDTDPSLDLEYANFLKSKCTNPNPNTTVDMDPKSSFSFDSHYYMTLYQKQGLFASDAALLTDPQSALIAKTFQNLQVFFASFTRSMINMGAIGVLTGQNGEIRTNCRAVN